jgi:hypothetical protein
MVIVLRYSEEMRMRMIVDSVIYSITQLYDVLYILSIPYALGVMICDVHCEKPLVTDRSIFLVRSSHMTQTECYTL